jgi:hypothetical protein
MLAISVQANTRPPRLERGQAGEQRFFGRIAIDDRAYRALDLFHFGPQGGMPPFRALAQRRRLEPAPLMLERDDLVLQAAPVQHMLAQPVGLGQPPGGGGQSRA